jgi:hypothetical protein
MNHCERQAKKEIIVEKWMKREKRERSEGHFI